MNVSNVYNTQARYSAAASKDKQLYEGFKSQPKKPTPAEITQSLPPSQISQINDGWVKQGRSFQFTNDKNIDRERSIHQQVKAQLLKDGYTTKAAMIAQNYSTRSEKGRAMFGN